MVWTHCRCILMFLAFGSAPVFGADPTKAVEEVLRAYEQAWGSHDGHAVASFYFEPAMRISATGPVVRPTQADQEAFFSGFLAGLVKAGYARSSLEELQVRLLDPQTAIASGVTVRSRADGRVFARVGVTYGLRNTPVGWRIFLSATHEPDSVLRFR
jgi:uncharacterized protein (TIGR02246 family)